MLLPRLVQAGVAEFEPLTPIVESFVSINLIEKGCKAIEVIRNKTFLSMCVEDGL